MAKSIVVIPTYNEIGSIAGITARILAVDPQVEVLVVDDNSPDGTGALADRLAAEQPRLHVMHRTEKNGLGAAYAAGFAWALERDYDFVVEMDADGSHQPEELPRLTALLESGCDMAIGTRWIPGGVIVNWPAYRKAISRSGTAYARILLRSRLHDLTSGYRGFRAESLRAIDFTSVNSQGYCFQIELAWLFERSGARIGEFPITFVEREEGVSKMSTGIVVEALAKVTGWGLSGLVGRAPARLALPAAGTPSR
ncbi:polyprenol monophosphomannose synthase [Herbiconiux moechotypicola]|uniref:Polyprenol monophosphomannose synthase n=1 Tax=Herbiconiux moechotypicola TaxID=637393 RepID=A0ABN3DWA5_9MICO|nr:polyprenol monophosphomannose synthase [Herbiconiux moechotypicola]MCS5730916.1 polyprenol monophosphomannose synthase [Herbiconiux moechotypicola]